MARPLHLNNVIGKKYKVDVGQITKISSFRLKTTKYTQLRFTDEQGQAQKALILSSNSILFGKQATAGDVLKLAQKI